MNQTIIKKTEARKDKSKKWQLLNESNGHYITIIFSKELEDEFNKNNHSFRQLQSEQINAVLKLMENIDRNYVLEVNSANVGESCMPLTDKKLKDAIVAL